jgi:TolB-like protein/tetratricopeptide (TPR) repeat protein
MPDARRTPRLPVLTAFTALLVAAGAATPLGAQVRGTVSDPGGHPVVGALVELYSSYERLAAQGTDSLGRFRFAVPVAVNGMLVIRAIGFAPVRRALASLESDVRVTMQPLPIQLAEVRVSGEPAYCPAADDPRARDLWSRAARHYDVALSSTLIRSQTLVFAADVPADSLGLMDTTRLRRVVMGEPGETPRAGWRVFYGQRVPFLESIQAWQFGDPSFARVNRIAFPPGSAGDSVIAFCSGLEGQPVVRGWLTLSPDTTFATASWDFVTPQQGALIGGRVLFARMDPTIAGQPLLAITGFFWRNRGGGHGFYQQWMEFREWTRCESYTSCLAPVPLADRSVAVLSLGTAGADTGAAYLGEGIADGISDALAHLARLKVIPRAAVVRMVGRLRLTPAALGVLLGTSNLVTGTVERVDDRLRIHVELRQALSGRSLWSANYDTSAAEILGVQANVAEAVAARLVGVLDPAERSRVARRLTSSPAAYDHYLRGNRLMRRRDLPADWGAIAQYDSALGLDSTFGAARGRLSVAYGEVLENAYWTRGAASDSIPLWGLRAANRALESDSTDANAWLGGGHLLSLRGRPEDLELAPAALHRAVALDPSNDAAHELYAAVLVRLGRFDEAETEYIRALALSPSDPQILGSLGLLAYTRRAYRLALQYFGRVDAVDSTLPALRIAEARVRVALGDVKGAVGDASAAVMYSPEGERASALAALAEMEARAGDRDLARQYLRSALRDIGGSATVVPGVLGIGQTWNLALAAAALGDADLAMTLLERTRPRGPWLWSYLILEGFDPLRADPRFRKLLDETRPPGAQDPA